MSGNAPERVSQRAYNLTEEVRHLLGTYGLKDVLLEIAFQRPGVEISAHDVTPITPRYPVLAIRERKP
jgi:hypothetical protein